MPAPKSRKRAWRFSIANLLVLTTVSAVLLSLLGRNELLLGSFGAVATLVLGNILLLVAVLAVRRYAFYLLPRMAADCAVAILIGLLWEALRFGFASALNLVAYFLIQVLTLSLWLEFIPRSDSSSTTS